jgi:hypothetical protein
MLLASTIFAAASAIGSAAPTQTDHAEQQAPAASGGRKPNILVIFGDDIGPWDVSAYNRGIMGYRTPNIDRIVKEGAIFTDHYAKQSCTAGRAAFITGQSNKPFVCWFNTIRMHIYTRLRDAGGEETVPKFPQHFLWIASAMIQGGDETGMWDENDGFFYDVLRLPSGEAQRLKVR